MLLEVRKGKERGVGERRYNRVENIYDKIDVV